MMCEAERRIREIYRWLEKNHKEVYIELLQKDAEEAKKKALYDE